MVVQADTIVILGMIERDLTGDGQPEVLRLIGSGQSIDSLDVTFLIESSGEIIFRMGLHPLTTASFAEARRVLSSNEHRARLNTFGDWFFGDTKFMRPDEFVEMLLSSARLHVPRIPEVIARDRRRQLVIDSLVATGHSSSEIRHKAPLLVAVPLDTAGGARTWEEIQTTGVTVFTYSPGGDTVSAIAWSMRDQRFYHLWVCC
jgi:hypothetical protein